MKKVIWQTRSRIVFNSFQCSELLTGANGGNAYDLHAAMALKKNFEVSMDEKAVLDKKENNFRYWYRMKSNIPDGDVIIKEPYAIVFGCALKKSKEAAIIHHIDDNFLKKDMRHRWFANRLKKRLRKADIVITVSKYWEDYLSELGCKKIKIIYNSFNTDDFILSNEEIKKFKSTFGFNEKPLIYIGKAHRPKGVYEVYESLHNSPYQLVMTGSNNHASDLPVKFLKLDRHDYLCLLHASDIVITLSNMVEGWSRIAHEAMLSKTPVIGSGTGGMKELLEKGSQRIVKDIDTLPEVVKDVLKDKEKIGQSGYDYVKKFDTSYFEKEWTKTISELLNE